MVTGEKAHLIYLMPNIINCIATKESDLRNAVRKALLDVNETILGGPAVFSMLPDDDE